MINFKKITATVLAFSCIVATGCSLSSSIKVSEQQDYKTITFSWWGTDARNEYTLDAIKSFERLHPNIKVEAKYGDWSGFEKRTKIEMASDTEADVMQINYAWISQFSPDGKTFYDLNKLSNIIDLSNFTKSELSSGYQNGKLQAIPIALNDMTFFYNKKTYKKYGLDIPKTLDDLYNEAKVMSKDNIFPMSCVSKSAWYFATSIEEQRTHKRIFDKDNKLNFGKAEFSDMISLTADLIKNKVIDDLSSYDKTKIYSGKYAGTLSWITDVPNTFANVDQDDFVVGDYILENSNNDLEWYVKPATMYAINANTENPDESALLLDFLLNSSEMAKKQGLEKGIPISQKAKKTLESDNLLKGLQWDAYEKMDENYDQMKTSSPYFEETSIIEGFYDAVNRVLYKNESADSAASEFLKITNSIVK